MGLVKTTRNISIIILYTFAFFNNSECFFKYQKEIPNGNIVPNPCDKFGLWAAVGHMESSVGTPRKNPFGTDFALENFRYTVKLHTKDSDGDGYSNGRELNVTIHEDGFYIIGRPNGHPGICEPVDHPKCAWQNFRCPQLNDGFGSTHRQNIQNVQTPNRKNPFMRPNGHQTQNNFAQHLLPNNHNG